MTDHYAEAERLLAVAAAPSEMGTVGTIATIVAAAQAHATLASVGLDRAEIEKLRAENARLNRVIDEKVRDHDEEAEIQERIGKALSVAGVSVSYNSVSDEYTVHNHAADEAARILRGLEGMFDIDDY